mgnify:FL=1
MKIIESSRQVGNLCSKSRVIYLEITLVTPLCLLHPDHGVAAHVELDVGRGVRLREGHQLVLALGHGTKEVATDLEVHAELHMLHHLLAVAAVHKPLGKQG